MSTFNKFSLISCSSFKSMTPPTHHQATVVPSLTLRYENCCCPVLSKCLGTNFCSVQYIKHAMLPHSLVITRRPCIPWMSLVSEGGRKDIPCCFNSILSWSLSRSPLFILRSCLWCCSSVCCTAKAQCLDWRRRVQLCDPEENNPCPVARESDKDYYYYCAILKHSGRFFVASSQSKCWVRRGQGVIGYVPGGVRWQ